MKLTTEQQDEIRAHGPTTTVGAFARQFKTTRAVIYGFMKRNGIQMKLERQFKVFKREPSEVREGFFNPDEKNIWI